MVRSRLRGEPVVVERREQVGLDPGRNPIYDWVPEVVEDVLVEPGSRSDVSDSQRPDGVRVAWTLHFPKVYTASLSGCRVQVRDDKPRKVIGDPHQYTNANTPTRWNRPAELEGVEG